MKISFNLLKTLIDFDWSPEELAERLTMSGSEVETSEVKGADIKGIVTAKIVSVDKIPGSDKLTLCRVYDGKTDLQVVCGAPNVSSGLNVLFAPPSSTIPGMAVERAVIHGHESFGMILSEFELGLTDDAEGIAVLPQDVKPGIALEKLVDYRDTIFDLEITPNRPDCLSHLGIAREIQALGGGRIKFPETSFSEIDEPASDIVKIAIDDASGCPRYTGRVVRNVKIGHSPLWLKMMVYYLGMRPINNVVDITNFVMMETGHPLHAFDFDLFSKPEVLVRRAGKGEEFITLDGVSRKLDDNHLLITDGEMGVAIAGIMGGEKSEVSQSTENLLIESAYFDPVTIRKGSKSLGLTTESSRRFERGADPEMAPMANDRACGLIVEMAGGSVLKGMVDVYPGKFVPVKIELRPSRVNKLLGTDMPAEKMRTLLAGLDIEVSGEDSIVAQQPSFRPDLTREVDLMEEIARIHGLDNIQAKFRPGGSLITPGSHVHFVTDKVRFFLVGMGATEIFPLTLIDTRVVEKFGLSESTVRIINPISEEMGSARPNLILSMLPVIRRNFGFKELDLFLFEIGNYFIPAARGELPSQKTSLIMAQTGMENPVFWDGKPRQRDLFSIKGAIEDLADYLRLEPVSLVPAAHFAFDQTRSFQINIGETPIGYAGKLSLDSCSIADIKGDVYIAELDFEKIVELIPPKLSAAELDRFPSADRDIAIIVPDKVKSAEIMRTIRENGEGLVDDVWIFDLYRGKNIPGGQKSLAYSIKYRLPDRTLTDSEVDAAHSRIAEALREKFGAQLRS